MMELWQRGLNLVQQFSPRDVLDILLVSAIVYKVLDFSRQTRGKQVVRGLVVFVVAYLICDWMQLQAISYLMRQAIGVGAIALVIVFQPELRRALERMGGKAKWLHSPGGEDRKAMLDAIIRATLNLSRTRTGALMVIERETALEDIIETGVKIEAQVSAALLENIFVPNTPLHDGAVIFRGQRIQAAACVLPLTAQTGLDQELGTRHRAALGMSENSDATIVVVSEETGTISVAEAGQLYRHLNAESLRERLAPIFTASEPTTALSRWRGYLAKRAKRKGGGAA